MEKEKAIDLAKTKWWKGLSNTDVVSFQLFETTLCMDFSDFHGAVEDVLGRPVYTHEFGSAGIIGLREEFLKVRPMRTLKEIIDLIPEEKRILI